MQMIEIVTLTNDEFVTHMIVIHPAGRVSERCA